MLTLLWLVFGGFLLAAKWFVAGVLCLMLVVTIPWARACFTMASYAALPFGRQVINRELLTGETDIGTGPLGDLGNAIWFVIAGWWLFLGHVFAAALWALTIIGVPFARIHLNLAGYALAPIGKVIVDDALAQRLGV